MWQFILKPDLNAFLIKKKQMRKETNTRSIWYFREDSTIVDAFISKLVFNICCRKWCVITRWLGVTFRGFDKVLSTEYVNKNAVVLMELSIVAVGRQTTVCMLYKQSVYQTLYPGSNYFSSDKEPMRLRSLAYRWTQSSCKNIFSRKKYPFGLLLKFGSFLW